MPQSQELLHQKPHKGHMVQLYGADPTLLVQNVGRYLADGLKAGDAVIVVATKDHSVAFSRELQRLDARPDAAEREGQLVFLDARRTLGAFMIDGQPDRESFESSIGTAV